MSENNKIVPDENEEKKMVLSKEINSIIDYALNEVLQILPSVEITPELFFYSALDCKDSVLVKRLSTMYNSITIENLSNTLFSYIQTKSLSAVRPGRVIKPSSSLTYLLLEVANDELVKPVCKTSFDVLMMLFNHLDNPEYKELGDIFIKFKITLDSLIKINRKLNENEEEKKEMKFTNETGKQNVKNPSLIHYCTNLNLLSVGKSSDRLTGRKKEIEDIDRAFLKYRNGNVLLVGESGVGKTAIINGLAYMIQNGYAPVSLRDKELLLFNPNEMISGTSLRGMFEERSNTFVKQLQKRNNIILVIEDIHRLMTQRKEDDYDFPTMFNNILNNTNVKLLCTTTQAGYSKNICSRSDIERKFQVVRIDEPTEKDCFDILLFGKKRYEKCHNILFEDNEQLNLVIKLCKRYITDKKLPASAFDIIDEIGSLKRSDFYNNDEKLTEKRKLIENTQWFLENVDANQKDMEENLKCQRLDIAKYIKGLESEKKVLVVSDEDIYKAVALHTDIPIDRLSVDDKASVKNIDKILKNSVIGQDDAVESIARAIKRSKVGLTSHNRPLGVFFLLGESGVGKTLLAKMLAKEIFGDEKYLVKFDMSEYCDSTSVNKLIGASAGYIGYDKGGLLTEAVKEKKYCVLLLDEIEKAHVEVHNLCLQLFDEGYLTDNTGCKVDFRNTIIILTSNVGARKAAESNAIGFVTDEGQNKKRIIEKELKGKFPPEFLNRIDEIVYFNRLKDDDLRKIIRLELKKFTERLNEAGYNFEYDNEVVDYLLKDISQDKGSGARPIVRSIQNNIERLITDLILENDYENGKVFDCHIKENSIEIG